MRFFAPSLARLLVVCALAGAAAMASAGHARAGAVPTIVVDGTTLSSDVPAVVQGDRVFVPLRGVFERFGAAVSFDDADQMAIARLSDVTVKVSLRTADAWINESHRTLDVGAREVAGRVMVPLRFVAEALGVSVDYEAASNTVVIVSGFRAGSFAAAGAGSPNYMLASAPEQAPRIEDLSPGQNALIGSQYPQIYARFNGGSSAVNPNTVSVMVDGQDVTGAATISSAYVAYTPSYALQTGQHTVEITGNADDGTPFSASWTFRVDAGTGSIYSMNGGGGYAAGFNGGFFDGGFNPFFRRFGFFPPGFSVFTPGPLFFTAGNVIEVILVSRFFPFGSCFFTIDGIPGNFALTPWPGNPGFFWGFATVPFGAISQRAVIAGHFTMPGGHHIVVHSTAPMVIAGNLRQAPPTLRYAVVPSVIGRPPSPHKLVVFHHLAPQPGSGSVLTIRGDGTQLHVFRGNGQHIVIRSLPETPRYQGRLPWHELPLRQSLPGMPSWQAHPLFRPSMPVVRLPLAPAVRPMPMVAPWANMPAMPVVRPMPPPAAVHPKPK